MNFLYEEQRLKELNDLIKKREEEITEKTCTLEVKKQKNSTLVKEKNEIFSPELEEKVELDKKATKLQKQLEVEKTKNIQLNDQLKLCQDKKPEIMDEDSQYDLEFELSSFKNMQEGEKDMIDTFSKHALALGIIANGQVGKTHILAKLFEKVINPEKLKSKGISVFSKPFANSDIMNNETTTAKAEFLHGIDIMGFASGVQYFNKSTEEENLSEKTKDNRELQKQKIKMVLDSLAISAFTQSYLLEICQIIIIVVGTMTFQDQILIQQVIQNHKNKTIFVIHNYFNLISVEDVLQKIKIDIESSFQVVPKSHVSNKYIFEDKKYSDSLQSHLIHLIYAQENTLAGKEFNGKTLTYVKEAIQGAKDFKPISLIESLTNYLTEQIK